MDLPVSQSGSTRHERNRHGCAPPHPIRHPGCRSRAAAARATRSARPCCAPPCSCFSSRAITAPPCNEVAERLNITKPALYNYFRSKDEILFECWAMGQERVDDFIADINADGGTGLVKLRKLMRAYAEVMATDFGASLVRFDVRDLSDANAEDRSRRQAEHRPYLSQLHHRGHRRRLDQAVRRQAVGLCHRRIAELDRALVSIRRAIVAEGNFGRVHRSSHRGTGAQATNQKGAAIRQG